MHNSKKMHLQVACKVLHYVKRSLVKGSCSERVTGCS